MEQKPTSKASENMGWLLGTLLIVLGAVALIGQWLPGGLGGIVWALIFGGAGAAFFVLVPRSPANRWALIPGYVLAVIGALILFGTVGIPGELIGIFVMLAIGFPFLYLYLRNRKNWWALIPAYTMGAMAGVIALGWALPESEIVPAYIMFAIALPFYYVFIRNRKNWWALIPAGVMTLIGFGIFVAQFQYILPIALIAVGVFLLVRQLRRDEGADKLEPPKTGPQADKPSV